jgi:Spy/CpxP family protein refolding chaperone
MEGKMSQRMFLVLMCALFVVLAGALGLAQTTPGQAASQAAGAASQAKDDAAQAMGDPETKAKADAKLQELSTELNLTDEQKTQLKPVLQGEVRQLKGVHDDASLSPDQKKAKMTEIHESTKSQMSSILTPEQQKKLAAMKEEKEKEDHNDK